MLVGPRLNIASSCYKTNIIQPLLFENRISRDYHYVKQYYSMVYITFIDNRWQPAASTGSPKKLKSLGD